MSASSVLKLLSKGFKPAAVTTGTAAYFTPEEADATFGGILARGAEQVIAHGAKLEKQGFSRDQIWQATTEQFGRGAFKGPEGLWRVEFEDYIDEIRRPEVRGASKSLADVLNRNPINYAYEGLRNVDVYATERPGSGTGMYSAGRNPVSGQIEETMKVEPAQLDPNRNTQASSTVLHETQHAIQNREKFPQGGSPESAGSFDNYRRIAGEIEARNVEIRAGMSPSERFVRPPWETQDVAEMEMLIDPRDAEGISAALKRQEYRLAALGITTGVAGAVSAEGIDESSLSEDQIEAVEKARKAGYTDAQISAYLQRQAQSKDKPEVPYALQEDDTLSTEEIQAARQAGFSDEQIAQYQNRNNQLDYTQINPSEFPEPAEPFTWESEIPGPGGDIRKRKLNNDEVLRLAAELKVDPRSQEGINAVYSEAKRREFQQTTSETVATLQEIAHVDRPWQWFKSHFSNNASAEYERVKQQNVTSIVDMAKQRGIDLQYRDGQFFAQDQQGTWQHVTPGFLQSIGKAKFEIAGGIGGAAGGAGMLRALGPYGRRAQVLAGMIGGVAGAVAGDQVDYLAAAIQAQEDWDSKIAMEKAVGTAQLGVVAEVVGYGIYKAGAGAYRGIRQAYRQFKDGNTEGAYTALKEGLGHITDEEVQDIVQRWETLNQRSAPGRNLQEQALSIAPTTRAGGENIISATAKIDPAASSSVAADINSRAQSLLQAVRKTAPEDTGRRIIDNLRSYENEVKTNYQVVKDAGREIASDVYRFDLRRIGIRPLVENKMSRIEDPAVVERLQRVLTKIDTLTESREFDDLLELRKTVNDYKFNRRINNKNDYDAINEVLAGIDQQINNAVGDSDDAIQWLNDWKDANRTYAQYAQVRDNVLWKAVRKPGASEQTIARALIRYAPSIDNTYDEVISKLSPQVKANVESSVADQLVNKYTAGAEGEFRAVQFPQLADALKVYNFDTPDAARVKEVVNRMAEVYQNDVRLAYVSGNISLPQFQSYLTTDPVVRAQYEVASSAFNFVKRLVPGRKADTLALINKVAKLLEDPLNTKTTQQVIEAVRDEQNLRAAINRMQSAIARDQAQNGERTVRAKVYKDSRGRMFLRPGKGLKEIDEPVPLHRIVPEETAKSILQVERLTFESLTNITKRKLLDEGFVMIRFDDGQVIRLDRGIK